MAVNQLLIISMSAEQLAEYLDEKFKPRCIQPGESEILAHRYAGKRDLIEYLIQRIKHEKEKNGSTTQITVR